VLFVDNSSVHTLDYTAIDYNDWYTINDYDSIAAIWTSASLTVWNKTQFSAYQSATGQDHHSFMADALLSNVANCDFHLTSASPCINAGLNIGLANDFDLNQRPASGPCDVGAYQYLSTAIGSTHELFNNLRVYPNPAETNLNIDGVTTPLSVEIINNTGDTMYEGFLHPGKSVIDVHRFPSATYIVHLFANDKNSISRKIVIER
jgi:hypothetical protein